jgi:hypothetical protein
MVGVYDIEKELAVFDYCFPKELGHGRCGEGFVREFVDFWHQFLGQLGYEEVVLFVFETKVKLAVAFELVLFGCESGVEVAFEEGFNFVRSQVHEKFLGHFVFEAVLARSLELLLGYLLFGQFGALPVGESGDGSVP